MDRPATIDRWHELVAKLDPSGLEDLLAEDAVFHSPAVHAPQEGKVVTTAYLAAAMAVLGPTLRYRHEWYGDSSAVLEFTAELDGLLVHGVDMISWDEDGKITEFTVMARPFTGLEKLVEAMSAELQYAAGD